LEAIASGEIEKDLGGEVKRSGRGFVVFRVAEITDALLRLRTVEDVFLLAWGTDQLTYKAEDLEKIRRWTARQPDWPNLLRLHHLVHAKPKGKPSYRLVTQMEGHHGYLRRDARKALALGLDGHVPASWRPAEENAAIEFWLTIQGATAFCGVRLSDRAMRHRTWKLEHRPASLRPTVAAAMVRLADIRPRQIVLDPMCGAGTILAEHLVSAQQFRGVQAQAWGGDCDLGAVRAAAANLSKLGHPMLGRWDARRLPLAQGSVDRVVSNPPFGKQLASPEEIGPLYRDMILEYNRVLRPGGMAVLLASESVVLHNAARAVRWQVLSNVNIRLLGQAATISVWRKPS
jgi:23S rRNA G2445 N2-methylase RlmL